MFVRNVLRFRGQRVLILFEDCLNVPAHGEKTGTLFLVSLKVNAGVLSSFPLSGDNVMLFESGEEVFGMAFLHIIKEIIDYE